MNTQPRAVRSAIMVLVALALAGLMAPVSKAQETSGEALRVCAFPAALFFYRDAQGVPAGFELDLITSFAAAAKLKTVIEDSPGFDQLLKDTESGRCQLSASQVTVTEERKARLAFSRPYFPNRVVVVQKTSSGFAVANDLKGKRVAAVRGTLSVDLVGKITGVKVVEVVDDEAAFQALLKGETDALACDSAVVLHYLTKHPELGIAFPVSERAFFAFALPLGSKHVGPLNDHLNSLVRSGAFTKMLAKHFGADNADMLAGDIAKASARP